VEKGKKSDIPICHMAAVGDLVSDDSDLPRPAMQLIITRVRISQLVAERHNDAGLHKKKGLHSNHTAVVGRV
jgi:hypothetical protein